MRAYVLTTGALYVALFAVHMARLASEGSSVLHSPAYVITSLGSLVMTAWSIRALKSAPATQGNAA